jgi:type IV pilus assembly protein PilA
MRTSNSTRATQKNLSPTGGFSLIELLIVVAIILIIVAIAIPNLLRSRMAANEASTVENMRTINTASVEYNTTYQNGYPPLLLTLGGTTGASATCNLAILIDPTITTPPYQKSGYTLAYSGQEGTIAVAPTGCGAPGYLGYLITAVPISQGVTGQRSFCSNEPATIYFDVSGAAIASATACGSLPPL